MGQAMFVEMLTAVIALLAPPQLVAVADTGQRALATACNGRDGWSDAAPPARIYGQIYYVGTCGITVLLIATLQGHVLIDGATEQAVPGILANIRRLGFDPRDVKLILNTHAHIDHAGGLAALKRATGAQLLARAPARTALESGQADADDPQASEPMPFAGVRVDRIVTEGEVVRLGALALTARATPGHVRGGTSWTWRACEGRACRTIVYADSLSAVSADGYRFRDHPALVAQFRTSFARVAGWDCGLLLTPHPGGSDLFERFAGSKPLADRAACKRYAAVAAKRLNDRLAKEAGR